MELANAFVEYVNFVGLRFWKGMLSLITHLPLCTKSSVCPVCICRFLSTEPHSLHPRASSRRRTCNLSPSPSSRLSKPPISSAQKKRIVLTSPTLSLTLLGHIPLRPLRLRLLYQLALMVVFGIYFMNLGFRRQHGLPVYAVENSSAESGPPEDLDEMGLLARGGREG